MKVSLPRPTTYGLHISKEIELRLGRCRASIRSAIRERLQEIVTTAGKTRSAGKSSEREPPLRFYVYEGYRVFYQIDPASRRVVVLDFEVAAS
jgi:mRNA-degrading endonuclease RelE of RelBE toxin-antitoxin system